MHSMKTLISFAVPAVAATGLLGILFWLFQRKKPPGDRKPTDPPDKITTKRTAEDSISVSGNTEDSISVSGNANTVSVGAGGDAKESVEVFKDERMTEDIVPISGEGDNIEKVIAQNVECANRVDDKTIDAHVKVDVHAIDAQSDGDSANLAETRSDSNKSSDENNLKMEIDPVIAKVSEQLVEQIIKDAIAICVGNQCAVITANEQTDNDVDVSSVSELASVGNVTDAEQRDGRTTESDSTVQAETTEHTSIFQSQIEEQIVISSTESHLHSEPTNSSPDTSDVRENTPDVHNSENSDMVNILESQIILENTIISENSLPSHCEPSKQDCMPDSVSASLSHTSAELVKDVQADVNEGKCSSDTNKVDDKNVTKSSDCDAKSSQQCSGKTNCATESKVSKADEKKAPTKTSWHGNDRSGGKDSTNKHVDVTGGERLSNGDVSANCDSASEASNDSGKGSSLPGSTSSPPIIDEERIFEFNIPSDMCGLFIGTRGKTIKTLRDQSGSRLRLRNNPYTADFQICVVEGPQSAIDRALTIIRRKFPSIKYPGMDMAPLDQGQGQGQDRRGNGGGNPVLMPEIMQLSLPEGVSVDIVVSSIVDAGRLFVQQPTHPTFPSLERLNTFMSTCYIQEGGVPDIPRPIETGVICAAPMLNGWYRAQIMVEYEALGECDIKYVDYGGYSRISDQCIKQIRSDFMTLPFQAIECYLANITALQNETYFSSEAGAVLEELTQGKLLQCQVVGRADDGLPYVHIYQINGNSSMLMVNRELVNRGVCRWIEILS